jgi:hypothetical protein
VSVGSTSRTVSDLIETRNHAMGRRVRSSRLATRDLPFLENVKPFYNKTSRH